MLTLLHDGQVLVITLISARAAHRTDSPEAQGRRKSDSVADAVLSLLTPAQLQEAQVEARRFSELYITKGKPTK